MKKLLIFLILILTQFSLLCQEEATITLHNKGRYVTQTGKLIDGYKEGTWINTDRRGDTSYSEYQKDKLIFQ